MITRTIVIQNKAGLHARPAARFTQEAGKYQSKITLQKGEQTINPKSILMILSLGVSQGNEITLTAEGPDEADAIQALVELIESKFGEE